MPRLELRSRALAFLVLTVTLVGCGGSQTEPLRYAILESTVSVDRPAYTVGDSVHIHVTVRNVGIADTVVRSVCDRPMVSIWYRTMVTAYWQLDRCTPPTDPRGLAIAAGDSVAATFSYVPPEGGYMVRGGVMEADSVTRITTMQSPSGWVNFDVNP